MSKVIAIDPGNSKCGLILADLSTKIAYEAIVISSNLLIEYVHEKYLLEDNIQLIIGNGTTSNTYISSLKDLIPNLIIAEEKNTTYRAKERYFQIFPPRGLKSFLPREIFILNKNLDALAALIIMEDYYKCKFQLQDFIGVKTWLK